MAERFRARSKIYREKMNINRERKISTCYKKEIGGRGNDSAMVERGDKVMPMMLMATT